MDHRSMQQHRIAKSTAEFIRQTALALSQPFKAGS